MEADHQKNKSEIITLILADMRNRRLIIGLEATGLATDEFNTNLSYLIFSKIEIDKKNETILFNWYEDMIYDLLDTDLNTFRTHQIFLAERLYDALEKKKNAIQMKHIVQTKKKISFLGLLYSGGWFKRFDN